jgi:hypothetical protein
MEHTIVSLNSRSSCKLAGRGGRRRGGCARGATRGAFFLAGSGSPGPWRQVQGQDLGLCVECWNGYTAGVTGRQGPVVRPVDYSGFFFVQGDDFREKGLYCPANYYRDKLLLLLAGEAEAR